MAAGLRTLSPFCDDVGSNGSASAGWAGVDDAGEGVDVPVCSGAVLARLMMDLWMGGCGRWACKEGALCRGVVVARRFDICGEIPERVDKVGWCLTLGSSEWRWDR